MPRSIAVRALHVILFGSTMVSAQTPTPRALADSAYALLEADPERAMQLALRALPAARKAQDDELLHDVLNNIRYVHYMRGQHADLLERSVEALSVAERMGNHRTIGDDQGWISVALFGSGQDERGYEHARIALEHMRVSGDTAAITRGLSDMANASNILEKRGEAILHISEAIRLYEATGDSSGAAFAQNMLAAYHMTSKRGGQCDPVPAQGASLHRPQGHRGGTAVGGGRFCRALPVRQTLPVESAGLGDELPPDLVR